MKRFFLIGLLLTTLTACDEFGLQNTVAPELSETTATGAKLQALPARSSKISVSVYDFADLTGKRKDGLRYASNSALVTQGAEHYLIDALKRAGNGQMFRVYERAALNELLQERKLQELQADVIKKRARIAELENRRAEIGSDFAENVRALEAPDASQNLIGLRAQARAADQAVANEIQLLQTQIDTSMPPLKLAKYLIQGAIIDYDTNVQTGGAGAKILGVGAHTKYEYDMVTVSLRLTDVSTGEILLSRQVSRRIYAVSLQGTVFRYVSADSLLEVDAGITANEPGQLAMQEAIEFGLLKLITDGQARKLW